MKETELETDINKKLNLLDKEMKDIKNFKNKLIDLYLLELEENFSDILILDKDKYLDRFGEKMNLIITDKYSERSFERDDFFNLIENVEKIFLDNYYEVSLEFLKTQVKNLGLGDKNSSNDNIIYPIQRRSSINPRNSSERINKSKYFKRKELITD